ncbi:MAG: hypothetical protein Q7S22_03970 [Candidatus Micrarchaeota archaeon]|nr:hypothetical protein [Candidatus Micrarchaeota archaeon]
MTRTNKYAGIDNAELLLIVDRHPSTTEKISAGKQLIANYIRTSNYQGLMLLSKNPNAPENIQTEAGQNIAPVVRALIEYYISNTHFPSFEALSKSELSIELRQEVDHAFITLILNEHHKPELILLNILLDSGFSESTRIKAGLALVRAYESKGDFLALANIIKTKEIPNEVCGFASAWFEGTCIIAIKKAVVDGNYESLDIHFIKHKKVSGIKIPASAIAYAIDLFDRACENAVTNACTDDYAGVRLQVIARDVNASYSSRVTAGMKAIKFFETRSEHSEIDKIATFSGHPVEVREKAGLKVIAKYEVEGNSTALYEINGCKSFLPSVRKSAKEAIPRAEQNYVKELIGKGNITELYWFSQIPFAHHKISRKDAREGIVTAANNLIEKLVAKGDPKGLSELATRWWILPKSVRVHALSSVTRANETLAKNAQAKHLLSIRNTTNIPTLLAIARTSDYSEMVRLSACDKAITLFFDNFQAPGQIPLASLYLSDMSKSHEMQEAIVAMISSCAMEKVTRLTNAKDVSALQVLSLTEGLPTNARAAVEHALDNSARALAADPQAYAKLVRELGNGRPSASGNNPKSVVKRVT